MPASRTRFGVILFAVTLGIITYIDRVCISKVSGPMRAELGLNDIQWGYVLGAFTLAYALFEIPGGWMGDRYGPRRVLLRVVTFWSLFTALTGVAWGFWSLIIFRFLFGAGEAGAFPNITKMFTLWLPKSERSMAQGITWMCARWGGAFTPLLVVAVMQWLGWRAAFWAFGVLGIIWVAAFGRWFRDNPKDHPKVNAAELSLLAGNEKNIDSHSQVPWKRLLQSRTAWLLWIYYFCISYVWYFYVTWLPKYLDEGLKLKGVESAALNSLPLLLGGVGCFAGGVIASSLSRKVGGLGTARRIVGVVGMLMAGGFLAYAMTLRDATWIMIAMGMSGFFNDLSMPGAWGACMDVGGKHAGSLAGSMNMMGNFGGAVSPVVTGYLLTWTNQNWTVPLLVAAGTYLISAACWLFIDPVTPIEAD